MNWIKALCQHQLSEMRTGLKRLPTSVSLAASYCTTADVLGRLKVHAVRISITIPYFVQNSGNWPIY
ncbi:hypothetical protein EMIT0P44_70133 [Pseudomonas sp. IT-P44]